MTVNRKTYVDPEVQGALARRLMLHWAVFIGVAGALVIGLLWMNDPFTPFRDHLAVAARVYGPVLLVLVCLAPVFVYDSVKLSNRFTGPMLRFRRAARELAEGGSVERIELRRGDYWKEVADDFNRVIDRVQGADPAADRDA